MDAMNLIFCILSIVAGILTLIGGIIYMTQWSAFFLYVLGIYLMFATTQSHRKQKATPPQTRLFFLCANWV